MKQIHPIVPSSPALTIVLRPLKVQDHRQQIPRASLSATKGPSRHGFPPEPPHRRTGRVHILAVSETHGRRLVRQPSPLHQDAEGDKNHPSRAYGARSNGGNPSGRHHPRKTQTIRHHSCRLGAKEIRQDGSHDTEAAPFRRESGPSGGGGEDTTGRVATDRRQKLQQHDRQQICCRQQAHEQGSRSSCHHGIRGFRGRQTTNPSTPFPHDDANPIIITMPRPLRSKIEDSDLRIFWRKNAACERRRPWNR